MANNYAIVLASGSGTRFGNSFTPKHLVNLKGLEIINWTLSGIFKSELFSQIVIVTRLQDLTITQKAVSKLPILLLSKTQVTEGAFYRMDSFFRGLDFLNSKVKLSNEDCIVLFDANRPLTDPNQLRTLIELSHWHGSACLARQLVNGIAKKVNEKIIEVPHKNQYVEFVTPESIRFETLALYERTQRLESVVEISISNKVYPAIVPSSELNAKLTYASDLSYLQGLIEEYSIENPADIV